MTLVKCSNCGNERDLTFDQIKTVATENRHCPSCGIGKERVVVREERFQDLNEFVKKSESILNLTVGTVTPDTSGSDHEIDESSGIRVGPGGGIQRRPRKSEK